MFFIKQIPCTDTYLEVEVLDKKSFHYITEKDMFFIKQIPCTDTYLEVEVLEKKVSITLQKRICFHKTDPLYKYISRSFVLEKSFHYITERDMFFIKQIPYTDTYLEVSILEKVSITLQKRTCFS